MNYQDNHINTNIAAPNISQGEIIINYIEKYNKGGKYWKEYILYVRIIMN